MARLLKPILCYVTDRSSLPGGETSLLSVIERAAAAGVDWIQIRERDLSAAKLAALTRKALERAAAISPNAPRIIVNDRLDVAVAVRAGGVHLGETSLPPMEVARWVKSPAGRSAAGEGFLVGASCHSLGAARAAEAAGADYVFFGPVFVTPSKAEFGSPQGLEYLAEVSRALKIAVLAIGGVTLDNAASCLAAGASGIAAIRLFQNAGDFSATVSSLRRAAASPAD